MLNLRYKKELAVSYHKYPVYIQEMIQFSPVSMLAKITNDAAHLEIFGLVREGGSQL